MKWKIELVAVSCVSTGSLENLLHFLCHSLPCYVIRLLLLIQVEIEAAAVKNVADQSWLLEIELERVVLTPSGVLLGCWQVHSLLPRFLILQKSLVFFPPVLLPLTSYESSQSYLR